MDTGTDNGSENIQLYVDNENVYPVHIENIMDIAKDERLAYRFLQTHGLMHEERNCTRGQRMVKYNKDNAFVWSCKCKGQREQRGSRTDTLLAKSCLSYGQVVHMWFCFVKDIPAFIAGQGMEVLLKNYVQLRGTSCDMGPRTLLAWYNEFRSLSSLYISKHPMQFYVDEAHLGLASMVYDPVSGLLGVEEKYPDEVEHRADHMETGGTSQGPPPQDSVEIDESYFGKRAKYHRGTSRQKYIVFGIVGKKSKRCIFHIVPNVQKDTLVPLIQQHVHNSCPIIHDGLASYKKLHEYGYQHYVVDHSKTLVSEDGVHTNTIEGLWGRLKQRVAFMQGLKLSVDKQSGIPMRLASFLDEFSYRRLFEEDGSIEKYFVTHCKDALADEAYWRERKALGEEEKKQALAERCVKRDQLVCQRNESCAASSQGDLSGTSRGEVSHRRLEQLRAAGRKGGVARKVRFDNRKRKRDNDQQD